MTDYWYTGASAANIAVATWIKRLAGEKWVPAAMPGAAPGSPPTCVLRPCEVLLSNALEGSISSKDHSNRVVVKGGSLEDEVMPVARLSTRDLRTLQGLPVEVTRVFAWGTVKPPPPVDQLEALCQETITYKEFPSAYQRGVVSCSPALYTQLVGIWRGICIAHREKRLSHTDRRRIQQVCAISVTSSTSRHSSEAELRVPQPTFILPGHLPDSLYSLSRCVAVSRQDRDKEGSATGLQNDKEITAMLLCRVGYLFDISADSISSDGREADKSDRWPLGAFREEIVDLLCPSPQVRVHHALDFLKQTACFSLDQSPNRPFPPSPAQKKACTYSLWILATHLIGDLPLSTKLCDNIILKARSAMRRLLPDLHVYCTRGPGVGPTAFESRWLPVWPPEEGDESAVIRPVLVDDLYAPPKGCGVSKSSLLRSEHRMQPLGLFDHGAIRPLANNTSSSSRDLLTKLAKIDNILLQFLDISSILDRKYFSLLSKTTGPGIEISGGAERLQVVLHLLRVLSNDNSQVPAAPPMVKHDSLSIILKIPEYKGGKTVGVSATHTFPVYAIRGPPVRASQGTQSTPGNVPVHAPSTLQSILLAGSSHDYTSELEEIVCGIALTSRHATQSVSPLVRKALSLLRYLESEEDFFKYFERYFSEFEVVPEDCTSLLDVDSDTFRDDENKGEGEAASHHVLLANAIGVLKGLRAAKEAEAAAAAREKLSLKRRKNAVEERGAPADVYGPSGSGAVADTRVEDVRALPYSTVDARAVKRTRMGERVDGETLLGNEDAKRAIDSTAESFLSSLSLPAADKESDLHVPPIELQAFAGRGRGVLNLPAWMTTGDTGDVGGTDFDRPLSGGESNGIRENVDTLPTGLQKGRGRGVSNVPAWLSGGDFLTGHGIMTIESAEGKGASNQHDQFSDAVAPEEGVVGTESGHIDKKMRLDTCGSDSSPSTLATDIQESLPVATGSIVAAPVAGRGRGVSNAPAWLTNPTFGQTDSTDSAVVPTCTVALSSRNIVGIICDMLCSCVAVAMEDSDHRRHVQEILRIVGDALVELPPRFVNELCASAQLRSALTEVLKYIHEQGRLQEDEFMSIKRALRLRDFD